MKALKPSLLTACLLAGLATARADDKANCSPPTNAPPTVAQKTVRADKNKDKGVLLTGSYIKQNIRRNGMITDGHNEVLVIDQKSIRNSGASDLRQLLTRQGIH